MAGNVRGTPRSEGPVRVRREELIRPDEQRRDFPSRVAQRHLERREGPRWALFAYGIVLTALLIIGGVTYTTYAFSKYRGVVLPGVYVERTYIGEMTPNQAEFALLQQLSPVFKKGPVKLVYRGQTPLIWSPTMTDIGYHPYVNKTVTAAMKVGRQETFFEQLLDRLPVHPTHVLQLVHSLDGKTARRYIRLNIKPHIYRKMVNAHLVAQGNDLRVIKESPGVELDMQGSLSALRSVLGSLTVPVLAVHTRNVAPPITDAYATRIRREVENFLSHPPVIALGKHVIVMKRSDLLPMIQFSERQDNHHHTASLVMDVLANAVQHYVAGLAVGVDRNAQIAQLEFNGRHVRIVRPQHTGRRLDQTSAEALLLKAVQSLKPQARLKFAIATTQPAIDTTNPATLGITTFLGGGFTSFQGAGDVRTVDIQNIASTLDNLLISPNEDISFNYLVRTGWPSRVYNDEETDRGGTLVPGKGGAMQQVATTFLRAMYQVGLQVTERHAHAFRLPWYEDLLGLDAIVSPDGLNDLRFHNNTGKYLFLKTNVQPVRGDISISVYGPNIGWSVHISSPKILKIVHHGSEIVQQDNSLQPGESHRIAWAHDGADVIIHRTVTRRGGKRITDSLMSSYSPNTAIVQVGSLPTATPRKAKSRTPTPSTTSSATPIAPTPGLTPGPSPTPTFNH